MELVFISLAVVIAVVVAIIIAAPRPFEKTEVVYLPVTSEVTVEHASKGRAPRNVMSVIQKLVLLLSAKHLTLPAADIVTICNRCYVPLKWLAMMMFASDLAKLFDEFFDLYPSSKGAPLVCIRQAGKCTLSRIEKGTGLDGKGYNLYVSAAFALKVLSVGHYSTQFYMHKVKLHGYVAVPESQELLAKKIFQGLSAGHVMSRKSGFFLIYSINQVLFPSNDIAWNWYDPEFWGAGSISLEGASAIECLFNKSQVYAA